jgi:hypothetical protein
MPALKEPQFFATDTRGNQRRVTRLSDYLDYFRDATALAIGEASTCYLGSPAVPHKLKEFCPEARIIIMLRNPIDVMYAEHSECVFDGTEHIRDFRLALDSKEPRVWRSGRCRGLAVKRLGYRELVKFSQQVCNFLDVFESSHVHVIVYDDFASDTATAYKNALTFLGVDPNHKCSFDVIHANRKIRSPAIQDLLRDLPNPIRHVTHSLLTKQLRSVLGSRLNRMNTKVVRRPALDPEFRRRLQTEFACEVSQLGKLIGRDLSSWVDSPTRSKSTPGA